MVSPSRYECQQYFGQCSLSVVLLCLDENFYNVFNTRDLTLNAFFKNNHMFILDFWLCCLPCCTDFSLAEVCRGYSLVGVSGLPSVVASLVAEHWLQGAQVQQLRLEDSRVQDQQLWCRGSVVRGMWDGIFLRAHISGHWQVDSLPLILQGSPKWFLDLLFNLTLFHKHFPCHNTFFYKFSFI